MGRGHVVISAAEPVDIEVRTNERGAWSVYLNGQWVSDHRDHEAARIAARRHQGIDTERSR
jgi:hypothetical protein